MRRFTTLTAIALTTLALLAGCEPSDSEDDGVLDMAQLASTFASSTAATDEDADLAPGTIEKSGRRRCAPSVGPGTWTSPRRPPRSASRAASALAGGAAAGAAARAGGGPERCAPAPGARCGAPRDHGGGSV